jgi:hypothetical protein
MSDYFPSRFFHFFDINGITRSLDYLGINEALTHSLMMNLPRPRNIEKLSLDMKAITRDIEIGIEFINSAEGSGYGIKLPFENLPNFIRDTNTAYIYIHTTCGKFIIYKIYEDQHEEEHSYEILGSPLRFQIM